MLFDKLKKYSAGGALPMHMPGHKRNAEAFPWLSGLADIDITEIAGFDNLNDPHSIFASLEERMANLRGAGGCICLVNGSTSGVLAAVSAVLEGGGDFLFARGSHKSVYSAAELMGADVFYLVPEIEEGFGVWGSVRASDVEKALKEHPRVKLVSVTSPTYEGVISDIREIADVCHAHGAALFVDEAHGAHLGFGGFPESAVSCGADLVVESLHKTLPSLTQTAALYVSGDIVDAREVRRCAAMFQSSSPSYILSASIDGCVEFMERSGVEAAERWLCALTEFYKSTCGLKNVKFLSGDGFFARDMSKIVFSVPGFSGEDIMNLFRRRFNIELEMAAGGYAVAMTGMGDTDASIKALADAIIKMDKISVGAVGCGEASRCEVQGGAVGCGEASRCGAPDGEVSCDKASSGKAPNGETPFCNVPSGKAANGEAPFCAAKCAKGCAAFTLPEVRMKAKDAVTAEGRFYRVADAVGKISGEYVWAYPPGVPLLVPGEVIDGELAEKILTSGLYSTRGKLPAQIFCVGEY